MLAKPLFRFFLLMVLLGARTTSAQTALPSSPPPAQTLSPVERPLPELAPFLKEVRSRLHSDEALLDQYTFTEKHTERDLDARGGVRKVKSETYEVYPSLEPGHTYRRLVEKDGRALDARELAAEDRKHEKKVADDGTSEEVERRRAARLAQSRNREESGVQQVFRIYDIAVSGREILDGRPAIVLSFRPRQKVEASGRTGRVLKALAGRAWIDEEDRQLVRVDAELVDNLSFGLGVLARLHKGSRASLLRRKVNGEIWLPAQARFSGSARLLLFKGLRLDALSEYSDYRKFQVATSTDIAPPQTP
ncbi:MAG: hypothetical protein ABJC07_02700 [Acidobacteriota bacterium]